MDDSWKELQQRVDLELIKGTSFLFYALIIKLAAAGIISKEGFADELEKAIVEAEAVRGKETPNLDFSMGRALVKMLRDPNPPRWTPTVIPGGREND